MKANAKLLEVFPVRVDPQMKEDIAVLNAKKVDVAMIVRQFLSREIPRIKKKLSNSA